MKPALTMILDYATDWGVLVENDDSCEKHREKAVERYEREGDQRPEKKAMR